MKELSEKLPRILKYMCEHHYLKNYELTFALEYLGQTEDIEFEPYLRSVCLDETKSPVVREGAFYGLVNYSVSFSDVLDSFRKSSSPGLKSICKDYV
jgi:hypothetical protein